jgi:hypothetical protein
MIKEICILNSIEWDQIVKSFDDYDVFYLSGYSKAFMKENEKNGVPILLLYENNSDRAINVVLKRDIATDERFDNKIDKACFYDLISPYGYGGFWGNVTDWSTLNKEYTDYCISKRYICEFVRFSLFSDYQKYYNGEVETRTHNVVRSLDMPIEEMWMDFKQKVRKNVKRANSFNLKVLVENDGSHLEDFLRIYYSTMKRTNAENDFYFSKRFFEDLNEMKDNVMYFYAVYEEQVVSTELVLFGSQNCYSYLGGTERDYFDMRPNDFLKYEIIKWAKNEGLKNYVLGGGYGSDDGIFQYKLCLAPKGSCDYFIGRRIFDENIYKRLVKMRNQKELNERFFPLYRS